MSERHPPRLTAEQRKARLLRVRRISESLGFVGKVEYRHVRTLAGGAQYGRGASESEDLLIVYSEAFERDADPDDFSLTAILAHERGHQILARHPRLSKRIDGISDASEEILASIVGSLICDDATDRDNLLRKALGEMLDCGIDAQIAVRRLRDFVILFGAIL
jgi:hypothetical protein